MNKETINELLSTILQIMISSIATYAMFDSNNSLTGCMTLTILIYSVMKCISILIRGEA